MGILAWIVLGGLSGWLASIVMGTNARMGALANIGVGIVGAILGGAMFNFFGHYGVTGFNFHSLWVSFVGACVLLFIAKRVRR
jgi:uncharacterized membrane protein YeaQ/YmgE (transglycosylase-associated protein family)